jgi:hypothetical protein
MRFIRQQTISGENPMANYKFSSALGLLLWLAVCGLPCLALAADPTPTAAMLNNGTPVAVSTPAMALSKDDAALVAKINSLYYNYKHLGLHKFKCEVNISIFENMLAMLKAQANADDPKYKALKDTKFFINYNEKDGMKFTYTNYYPTGDANTDASLSKMLGAAQQIVNGFWESWRATSFEPSIDTSKATVTVKKTDSGYEIEEAKDTTQSVNIFNSDLLVTEVDGRKKDSQENTVTIKPQFIKTTDGLLMNSMTLDMRKLMNETLNIEYQDFQKYKLPSKCVFSVDMLGGGAKSDVTLEFSNYKLN